MMTLMMTLMMMVAVMVVMMMCSSPLSSLPYILPSPAPPVEALAVCASLAWLVGPTGRLSNSELLGG